jgi:hypothetical protein
MLISKLDILRHMSRRYSHSFRLVERTNHLDALLPPANDIRRFLQQLFKNFRLWIAPFASVILPRPNANQPDQLTVEMLEQYPLHVLLGELDKRQGDGFWHHVNHFTY